MEWNGMGRSEAAWNGVIRSGVEWGGVEWSGMEWGGLEWTIFSAEDNAHNASRADGRCGIGNRCKLCITTQ